MRRRRRRIWPRHRVASLAVREKALALYRGRERMDRIEEKKSHEQADEEEEGRRAVAMEAVKEIKKESWIDPADGPLGVYRAFIWRGKSSSSSFDGRTNKSNSWPPSSSSFFYLPFFLFASCILLCYAFLARHRNTPRATQTTEWAREAKWGWIDSAGTVWMRKEAAENC